MSSKQNTPHPCPHQRLPNRDHWKYIFSSSPQSGKESGEVGQHQLDDLSRVEDMGHWIRRVLLRPKQGWSKHNSQVMGGHAVLV